MEPLYLSKLLLDVRSPAVSRDRQDCYQMHRTVLGLFPALTGADRHGEGRVLYRIEDDRRAGRYIPLLVQARWRPDHRTLRPGYLAPVYGNPACKRIDSALACVDARRVLNFRLKANPTRKTRDQKSGLVRPMRVDLRGDEALEEWLRRKGRDGGFELIHVRLGGTDSGVPDTRTLKQVGVKGKMPGGGQVPRLTFGSALFEGRLRVTDRDMFLRTVASGIGSGKGFGFGLLSVAPSQVR